MSTVDFGVLALGTALGEPCSVAGTAAEYVTDTERVLDWGYHTYHRAGPDTTPTRLAARAARQALARAGLDAADVDLLVLASSDVPEYLLWDPSAALAAALGTRETPTLSLSQGCAAAVTAFQQVAGWFAVRPEARTVLLVAVNQVSEAHTNRMRFNTCLSSDGAAAVVLRRDHRTLRWLATEQLTDPSCADFFRVEYGGSAVPRPPEGTGNLDVDPLGLVYRYFRKEPEHLAEFSVALRTRVATVLERAMKAAGIDADRVAKFVYLNDNQAAIAQIADTVGIPLASTNAELAAGIGHCGAADHLISLDAYRRAGELAEGDVIALAGLSSGMHWFCTLLEA